MPSEVVKPDPGRIGGFLVAVGAMKDWQVEDVVLAQRSGDTRMFGEIAIAMGYVNDEALKRYVDSRDPPSPSKKT